MKNLLLSTLSILLITGISLAKEPVPATTTYKVNTAKSSLIWTGKKVTGEHTGTIGIKKGVVAVDGSELVGTDLSIDMTSITNTDLEDPKYNQKLVNHLKSDDFFSVEKFPSAIFNGADFKKDGNNYQVTGNLIIKGITNEVTFPVEVSIDDETLTAKGSITFDRSKWDVRYGSGSFFDGLGDKLIYDDVELKFTIVATK